MGTDEKQDSIIKSQTSASGLQRVYYLLSGDDEHDRACQAIPPSECTAIPRNYLLNVLNGAAAKLAEQVASAKVALPWLMSTIGAPTGLVGMLLPLRQAGSLLPQLAVAGHIRQYPLRKWFWVAAAAVQVMALLTMAGSALTLPASLAGPVIVGCLLVFSLARGVGSIAFQDVTGKTIPKGRRGSMLAARGLIGGLLAIAVGLGFKFGLVDDASMQPAVMLLVGGAFLWAVAAAAFASIEERPGAVEGGRNAFREARAGWRMVRQHSWFRRFLVVRLALLSVELAGPFYVIFARDVFPGQSGMLGTIVVAAGVAAALSSPFWGRFADWSSPRVLFLSGLMGAIAGVAALAIGLMPTALRSPYFMAGVFVLFGIAEAGVLLGRKTYLIDRVDSGNRATFVAFANSAMGIAALLFGGLGLIADLTGLSVLIAVLVAMSAIGGLMSLWLPVVSGDSETVQGSPSPHALGIPGPMFRTDGKAPVRPIVGERSFKRELLPTM